MASVKAIVSLPPSGASKSLTFADTIKDGDKDEDGNSLDGIKRTRGPVKPEPCFPDFITRLYGVKL